jgi:hypothetical protein
MVGLVWVALTPAAIAAPAAAARGSAKLSTATTLTPVPARFVGMDADGPMVTPVDDINLAQQFNTMVASGVESVRFPLDWATAQPYATWADVPAAGAGRFQNGSHGTPTDFATTDELVGLAAERGLTLLPTVLYAPPWDAGSNRTGGLAPPAKPVPYADFLTTLIDRYGPRGTFWAANPRIPKDPIRMWQIWNEPNLTLYWPAPFASRYVALLRAAHTAIKRADPGAKVVLAGLTNYAWTALHQIDTQPGARRLFDVLAVHPYSSDPAKVITFMELFHRAAARDGLARLPLLATEFGFPSALGQSAGGFDWDTTEAGEARELAQLIPMMAALRTQLNLVGIYYYTWIGDEYRGASPWAFAGLLRYRTGGKIVAKPALASFKRVALELEACRVKGTLATRCVKK